jgi:hypothetical protein
MIACGVLASPALADTPTNNSPPTVTGPSTTPQQGQTLTEGAGSWTGAASVTLQWYDCPTSTVSPTGCTAISGASTAQGSTYTLTQSDVGQYVAVIETADDGSGNTATEPSTPVSPVQPQLANNAAPSVTGPSATPQQGQTLTEGAGSWSGAASVAVQWYDCPTSSVSSIGCTPISGAPTSQGSTYTLTQSDVGQFVAVIETATDFSGNTSQSGSTPVSQVQPQLSNNAPPSVTGPSPTPQQGQTLTEGAGSWTGAASVSVQWYDCPTSTVSSIGCKPISGTQTTQGSTYTLTQSDVGQFVAVIETATDFSGNTSQVGSTPVSPVQPQLADNSLPRIEGTAQEGDTLTEVAGTWTGAAIVAVQWYDCPTSTVSSTGCTPISGAPTGQGSTYTATQSDVGQYIAVIETGTDFSGNTSEASSTAVGPVLLPKPGVQGTPVEGRALREIPAAWTPSPPNGVNVQWEDCDRFGNNCSPIGFPTTPGSAYTPTANDFGKYIVVSETADYGGGSTPSASSAALGPVSVGSTTALLASQSSAVTNQAVTLSATVTSDASAGHPSGSITFMNGGTAIGGCANLPVSTTGASATVDCGASFPASSPHLTAVFTSAGGSLVAGSASGVVALNIGLAASATSLDVSGTIYAGQSTTYTATVAPLPPASLLGPAQPSGGVEFFDGGQPIGACTNQPLIGGGATCTVTYATPGTHAITARYIGDSNFTSSTNPSLQTLTVVALPASPTNAPPVLGAISATMQWTFDFTPQYTKVLALVLNGAHQMTVTVGCAGRGCPFRRHSIAVGTTYRCGKHLKRRCSFASGLSLTGIFRSHHLKVGTRITVMITKPSWTGKYYRFTIRAGRGPGVRIGCLAPGATSPGGPC